MRTPLAVNPDGAGASYTPGDHGYTYITNGVNLRVDGATLGCSSKANEARCRRDWLRAEAGGFGPGTPEFCAFAIEVAPLSPGAARTACGRGRYVVGNGLGRPVEGAPVPKIGGGTMVPYLSTTSLRHTVAGRPVYVDSAVVPGLVVPTSRPELVGAIAWVRMGTRETFAIVNDTGPAFGEGTVALHQALETGAIGPTQPVGPIPLSLRCGAEELALQPPFVSRPDLGPGDLCRPGRQASGASDIRAYRGIEGGVVSVILQKAKPPMQGNTVATEITVTRLGEWAQAHGYDLARLRQIAECVAR